MFSLAQQPMNPRPNGLEIALHSGTFVLAALAVWMLTIGLLPTADVVTRSILASLIAGLAANILLTRKFGTGRLADFGLGWTPASGRHGILGVLLGAGAPCAVVFGAVAAGQAHWEPAEPGNIAWFTAVLLMGAAGEELLFRGYGFQFLVRPWPAATIAGTGALFGLTHLLLNQNIQLIGTFNTALWGALLGFAFYRTNSLWLPIGIHYGWNLALVLLGASLSGTTIEATGVQLRWTASDLWSGGNYGPEGGLLTTVAGVAVFLIVRRMR